MSDTPKSGALRELVVLALVILIGTPVAVWWGFRDGNALAEKAYAGAEESAAGESDDYDDYDDYDYDDGADVSGDDAGASSGAGEGGPEAIARGKALYQVHCVACHGADADGKGPAAVAFTPPPRDFTDPDAKWTLGRSSEQVFTAVSKGVPGTGMAGFSAAMSESELWDVVRYLESLPGLSGEGR